MTKEKGRAPRGRVSLQTTKVYLMAAVCLVLGLAIGYLVRGTRMPAAAAQLPAKASLASPHPGLMGTGHMPTLAEMKRMADKQASPLLEKLKTDPNNSALLAQVGAIYHSTHQFKEAAIYFARASAADPKDVAVRTKLAISLYRSGDVDGAIAQLNEALSYDPKDPNALFNLGLIRYQGKQDSKGALATWQQLLKTNPELSPDRKAMVQHLMAEAQISGKAHREIQGAPSND